MLKKRLLSAIAALFLVSGCTTQAHSFQKTSSTHKPIYRMGIGIKSNSSISSRGVTFQLKGTTTFSPDMDVINGLPEANDYAVFFLLDYKQIPVLYHQHSEAVIKLRVNSWSTEDFHVDIPNLKPGEHDLLCVLVRQPEKHVTPSTTAQDVQSGKFFVGRRVNLIVGSGVNKNPAFTNITNNYKSPGTALNLPYITRKKMEDVSQSVRLTNTGQLYFNLQPKHPNSNDAIVFILDDHQVTNGAPYPLLHLQQKGQISIPINIPVPHDKQPHELISILINEPFMRIEDNRGNLTNPGFIPAPIFANKITIDSESKN